jgi:undecaprenyl phosphate-alpha-L-ara4N flippase subunit ArnE
MWQLIGLALLQSLMLAFGQLTLKLALNNMPDFEWSMAFFMTLLTNWWLLLSGALFALASLLWISILKIFPLSMASPMMSMSYVFALVLAAVFLHETIAINRWIGVALIMGGCILVAK